MVGDNAEHAREWLAFRRVAITCGLFSFHGYPHCALLTCLYSCICQAAWCYLCGETWKTCGCPQWNEEMLIERANEIVDRQGHLGVNRLNRAAAIAAVVSRIQVHCDHGDWIFNPGAGFCENCHDDMRSFTMECGFCPAQFCKRCTRNRL